MRMLSEVLEAPDPINTEAFFSRLPVIHKIVIFSVHGYFGQEDVLGLPDTGGQVFISLLRNIGRLQPKHHFTYIIEVANIYTLSRWFTFLIK